MITYGELDFTGLELKFAHYTARRGRGAKIHTPQQLPKKFWDGDIVSDPSSYIHIVENGDLKIAPTAVMEVELPISIEFKFDSDAQKALVIERFKSFGIDTPFEGLEGVLRITNDGADTSPKTDTVKEVSSTVKSKPKPDSKPVSKKGKVLRVEPEQVWKLFGITFGDRIKVTDSFGWPLGEYIVKMNNMTAPVIAHAETGKEYDLFYLTGTNYEVITGGMF